VIDDVWAMEFVHGLIHTFPTALLARLKPGEKKTVEPWNQFRKWNREHEIKTRLEAAWWWLHGGDNLGFILEDSPFWVLDLDVHQEPADEGADPWPDVVHEAIHTLRPPTVRTPGTGLHAYFRLPSGLVGVPNLKAHVCHPTVEGVTLQLDIKLGGKGTLVVAPGSQCKGIRYLPEGAWVDPPELDPRRLFPSLSFLHDNKPFLKNERPLNDRVFRARQYLKTKAPICVSGQGARRTLLSVATHLTEYLDLPEDVALAVMNNPAATCWNSRCVDGTTSLSYPWTENELRMALMKAKGMVPGFGVIEWEDQQKKIQRDQVLDQFCEQILLAEHENMAPGPVPFTLVFQGAFDLVEKVTGEEMTQKRFGMHLRSKGVEEQRKGKRRQLCVLVPGGLDEFNLRLSNMAATPCDEEAS